MAVVVRINVHQHVGMTAPVQDERLFVVAESRFLAEDATGTARSLFDEGKTPGRPELFHERACATNFLERSPRGWSATRRRSSPRCSSAIHRWSGGNTA